MNEIRKSFFIGLLFATILSFSSAYATKKLPQIGNWNKRSAIGYNDVWGYTDPAGREYALLGVKNGTQIIDITDVTNLKAVSFIPSAKSTWKDIKTYKHYAYVVNESSGGMQIIDLSKLPDSAELVSTYDGFSNSHNLSIDVERGILYAEGNHAQPVWVMSLLNDPTKPELLNYLGVECHDILAVNGRAFISEGGHGTIGIFDTNDPANIVLEKRFQIPNAGYVHNAWPSEDGKYLMTTEETNNKTIKYWDISDLNNVTLVGEYLGPNQLAHNTHIKGDFAYVSHYGAGLRIVDLKDPKNLVEAAYFTKSDRIPRGFKDVWGAYPFFKSGKILVSDVTTGLHIVYFDGAVE